MSTLAICLYSKYSQRCKEFLEEMGDDLDVQLIPIDHPRVRDTVIKDNHGYHVKTVPCVFLMFPNGRLEKYEGSDAFVWLRKLKEVVEEEEQLPVKQTPVQTTPQEEEERYQPPEIEEDPKIKVEKMLDAQRERGSDQFITKKQENIKDLAQAMQRQRESEEENTGPPPLTQSLPINRP